MPSTIGFSWTRDWTCVSLYLLHCRQILYHLGSPVLPLYPFNSPIWPLKKLNGPWKMTADYLSPGHSCYASSYSIGQNLVMGVTSTAKFIDSNYTRDLRKWSLLCVWRHNGPLGARLCPERHLLLPDPICSHCKRRAMILCMPTQPILESVIKCELVPNIYLTAYFFWPLWVHCDSLNPLKTGH